MRSLNKEGVTVIRALFHELLSLEVHVMDRLGAFGTTHGKLLYWEMKWELNNLKAHGIPDPRQYRKYKLGTKYRNKKAFIEKQRQIGSKCKTKKILRP